MADYNLPNIDIKGSNDVAGESIWGAILGPIVSAVFAPKKSESTSHQTFFTPAVVRGLLIGTVVIVGGVLVYRAVRKR